MQPTLQRLPLTPLTTARGQSTTKEGGNYVFKGDDTVDAETGTTTQYVAINNDIVNAGTVTVEGTTLKFGAYQHEDQTAKNWDGKGLLSGVEEDGTANRDADAVTVLSLNNAVFDLANGYLEPSS